MKVYLITLFFIFLLFFCGCKEKKRTSNQPTSANVVSSQSKKDTADVVVHDVNTGSAASALDEMPNFHIGDTVTLEGEYFGWNASKAGCKNKISSPPVTRSDWILKISGGFCIYVTGHIPGGVDKLSPKGEKVKITGIIRKTESGQMYLEANK